MLSSRGSSGSSLGPVTVSPPILYTRWFERLFPISKKKRKPRLHLLELSAFIENMQVTKDFCCPGQTGIERGVVGSRPGSPDNIQSEVHASIR